jgi:hypothetical protein
MKNLIHTLENPNQILFDYVIELNKILEIEGDPKRKALIKKVRKNLQAQRRSLIIGLPCLFPNVFSIQADLIISDVISKGLA